MTELLCEIEKHLFNEMTSNLTYGFCDSDVEPLSLEEQKVFFTRDDVRNEMHEVIVAVFQATCDGWEYQNDFYRELIYDGPLGVLYLELQKTRNKSEFDDEDLTRLAYADYIPRFE
jgi:hypothetical protein